jgi:N-acetylglucosaminyldiphosphoundecaprenol N-acetyl-beta-D-mannosaminyltransferase
MLGESRYVCVANVNNLIEAYDDPAYHEVMDRADLVTPDGMPLVWALRLLGVAGATRVYGPDLTPMLCERAATLGVPVGFYGSAPEVLEDLTTNLVRRHPALRVAYSHSPPFRLLTPDEDERVAESINRFLAGRKRQAPKLLQRLGLEWLFRLLSEPRRLWRRYLCRNPRFVALFVLQLTGRRRADGPARRLGMP